MAAAAEAALAPFHSDGSENPYAIHDDLQQVMQDLVGIIRTESEMEMALKEIAGLRQRIANMRVGGQRRYNPGWNLSLDLRNMLLVSETVAKAALERKESRGGHTRDDYPMTDEYWAKQNVVVELSGDEVTIRVQPLPVPPPELAELLEDH